MNPKICTLCKQMIEEQDKAFFEEGRWSHLRCIKAKLNKLKATRVNPEVIDVILESYEPKQEAKKKRRFFRKA